MREGWESTTLDDLCTIEKGSSPTQKTLAGPFPLIVTGPSPLTSDAYQFEGEAVCVPLVSSTGHGHASLKRIHLATGRFAVANIVAACVVREDSRCSARFLWLYLQHHKDDLIVSRMKGTANVSLSLRSLGEVPVALPPLDEQRRIVDLIGAVDDAIEAADESATTTASALRAMTSALIARPDPSSTMVELGQITTLAGGHAFPTDLQGKSSGTFPFYKVSDMNRDGNEVFMTGAANWVDDEDRDALRFRTWPIGTVIFPKVGAALHTEKRRVLDVEGAFDNNVMGVSPGDSILPGYLLAYLETVRLGELAQPGAVPSINQGHVASLRIPLPSLDVQRERVATIDAARAAASESSMLATSLRSLRSNLLTALLSGEHEIPATYDAVLEGAA